MIEVRQTDEFSKWLDSLKDRTAKLRIADRLLRIEGGNLGDYKSLGDGLFEFRIPYGQAYRLYFTRKGNAIVILLYGGNKSSQSRDIKKACKIMKEFGL